MPLRRESPPGGPVSPASRSFALFGDPVAHSLSPIMHAAAFAALGLSASYAAVRAGARELPVLLREAARAGGANLTHPLKQAGFTELDEARGWAARLETCNTVWLDDGRMIGDNTDVAGIVAAAEELDVPEGPWLILGTGASARAAAAAASLRAAPVAVRSRASGRARAFLDWAAGLTPADAPADACVFVVRAIPDGASSASADRQAGRSIVAALDLVYARGETPWVRAARAGGLRAGDGRAVLVGQGAAALECWFPGVSAPVRVMREAVDAALG